MLAMTAALHTACPLTDVRPSLGHQQQLQFTLSQCLSTPPSPPQPNTHTPTLSLLPAHSQTCASPSATSSSLSEEPRALRCGSVYCHGHNDEDL